MILALMGSNPYPFLRLADCLAKLAKTQGVEVCVQTGFGPLVENCKCFSFAPRERILELMKAADAVVMQGGYGGCLDAISCGRVPVIMPRRVDLGESNDDQTELVNYLHARNMVMRVNDFSECTAALAVVKEIEGARADKPVELGYDVAECIKEFLRL